MSLSRRDLFNCLFRPLRGAGTSAEAVIERTSRSVPPSRSQAVVAVVQGRHCLAYQRSFCSTCFERCPVPSAIQVENGLPRVNGDLCTGCGVCQELCPAPVNAILLVPRRTPQRVG